MKIKTKARMTNVFFFTPLIAWYKGIHLCWLFLEIHITEDKK